MTALPEHVDPGHADAMGATCDAKGKGWVCDRPAAAKGKCAGHYQQQRRGGELTPLRDAHGADPRGLVQKTMAYPREDADAMAAEADRRGIPEGEVYREAVAGYLAKKRAK